MATPTRSHAVSTPKGHLPSTPNRPMASPRPGSSAVAQKSLAYKSPAVKTPASTYGHAHTVSASSQPSSTPLAGTAIHDELLALNSPAAALINSIVPTGLTPMTNGQEGLGIHAQGPHGFPSSGNGHKVRDPEAQRLTRLQQAMASLQSKAVGRGITRESVERVARLQGFEALWDEDNLTIAGNIVEIEINFNPLFEDKISDLVLKLNSADGESHTQIEATDILKKEIGADQLSGAEDLDSFSTNIRYLAQMDRINSSPNAFDIVGSLSQTLKSIWEEERKRMTWRASLQHARQGAFGNVHFDRKPKLGLCVDYWCNGSRSHAIDDHHDDPSDTTYYQATIACEAGIPGLSASLTWLTADVLVEEAAGRNSLDSEKGSLVPDWLNETVPSDISHEQKDQMLDEKTIPPTLDVHFSCELEPEVLLPHNVALQLNNQTCALVIDQTKPMTYQVALQKSRNAATDTSNIKPVEGRWSRRLPSIDSNGHLKSTAHSYALYSATQISELWVVPITRLSFRHPKQLAHAIGILRQHALVWTLLETLVIHPLLESASSRLPALKPKVGKRSNKPQATKSLDGSSISEQREKSSLPIDISLDLVSDPTRCKIDIFAPLSDHVAHSSHSAFLHVSLSIGPSASIHIGDLTGVPTSDLGALKLKVARMLETTKDIGIVLQWLLEQ